MPLLLGGCCGPWARRFDTDSDRRRSEELRPPFIGGLFSPLAPSRGQQGAWRKPRKSNVFPVARATVKGVGRSPRPLAVVWLHHSQPRQHGYSYGNAGGGRTRKQIHHRTVSTNDFICLYVSYCARILSSNATESQAVFRVCGESRI